MLTDDNIIHNNSKEIGRAPFRNLFNGHSKGLVIEIQELTLKIPE